MSVVLHFITSKLYGDFFSLSVLKSVEQHVVRVPSHPKVKCLHESSVSSELPVHLKK